MSKTKLIKQGANFPDGNLSKKGNMDVDCLATPEIKIIIYVFGIETQARNHYIKLYGARAITKEVFI